MEIEYSISDLAKEFSITSRSIRHYEDERLLSPLRRGTHRVYTQRDRVRLQLILRGKRLNFTLAEIREIIDLYDSEQGQQKQTERLLQLIKQRRELLIQQRKDIDFMLKDLEMLETRLEK